MGPNCFREAAKKSHFHCFGCHFFVYVLIVPLIFRSLVAANTMANNGTDGDKQRFIERGSHKGKGLAVFTSGGDSQGMLLAPFFLFG